MKTLNVNRSSLARCVFFTFTSLKSRIEILKCQGKAKLPLANATTAKIAHLAYQVIASSSTLLTSLVSVYPVNYA